MYDEVLSSFSIVDFSVQEQYRENAEKIASLKKWKIW